MIIYMKKAIWYIGDGAIVVRKVCWIFYSSPAMITRFICPQLDGWQVAYSGVFPKLFLLNLASNAAGNEAVGNSVTELYSQRAIKWWIF